MCHLSKPVRSEGLELKNWRIVKIMPMIRPLWPDLGLDLPCMYYTRGKGCILDILWLPHYTEQCKLLEIVILIIWRSFPLPTGGISRNLLPTISLCLLEVC